MNTQIDFKTTCFNDENIEKFYLHYRDCAKLFGCFYMGYIYENLNTKSRLGFTTNPEWQSEYIGNHLVDSCHLWNAVSNYFLQTDNKHFILQWKMIKPETSFQKDIVLYREEIGIGQDGISFCSNSGQSREFLYFAPEKNETAFMKYVSKNINIIKNIGKDFREASRKLILNNSTLQDVPYEPSK